MKKNNIEVIAIAGTIVGTLALGYISVEPFQSYGWTVFLLVPFLLGFAPPFIVSREKVISGGKAQRLGFTTLGIAVLCLLIFAIEGLICIAMASPILAIMCALGAYLAYLSQGKDVINNKNTSIIVLFTALGSMSYDYVNEPKTLIPVRTTITVNANIHKVWNNVVTFSHIEEPTDWLFETGIAYPTDATIEGTGVGAVRHCNFTTGSFVEPITTWDEPTLLQFDVLQQPMPMQEINPFWDKIHPPHLDGYFQSQKGQFQLTKLSETQTQLEGTTWYQIDITPELYWRFWSDFIIHRIHERVLEHIKKESEE